MAARIIVADPLELIVVGIRSWLDAEPMYIMVGQAATGRQLMELLRTTPCELVLLEVSLPNMDGIDTMRAVRQAYPAMKVLAFSTLTEIEYVNSMLIEGADGYLDKRAPQAEFFFALGSVLAGQRYLSDTARHSIDQGYTYTEKRIDGAYIGLTAREREIIRMVALERTNGEIAAALFISEDTVKTHRKNLMTKLNVRSTAGLVRYAIDRRWV